LAPAGDIIVAAEDSPPELGVDPARDCAAGGDELGADGARTCATGGGELGADGA
jgi:hypothetical protein